MKCPRACSTISACRAQRGIRSPLVESVFEYGSRRGAWRVLDVFREFSVKMSILGVARALEHNPAIGQGLRRARPRDRQSRLSLDRLCGGARGGGARAHPARGRHSDQADRRTAGRLDDRAARAEYAAAFGRSRRLPVRPRFPRRRTALLAADFSGRPHLVIPYSYEANDNRFNENSGFSTARIFSPTCATPSTCSIARANAARRSSSHRPARSAHRPPGPLQRPDQAARIYARL